MCPKLTVILRSVGISIPSRCQDGGDGDAGLQALLPQRETLQVHEAVLLRRTVDDGVLEDASSIAAKGTAWAVGAGRREPDGAFRIPGTHRRILEAPGVASGIVFEFGEVVTSIQELQHRTEYFWKLVGEA